MAWWHFPHEADMGIAGEGTTLSEAFEQAALALTAVITSAPIERRTSVSIACAAPNAEILFVDWLNALIYEMATRHLLFGAFAVETDGRTLSGRAWGERVDPVRHEPAVEVKGATFTALSVRQQENGRWCAQCVVDV